MAEGPTVSNRRSFLSQATGALAALSFGSSSSAIAQDQRRFFNFPLGGRDVVGRGQDPSVPSKLYDSVAAYLQRSLVQSNGTLEFKEESLGSYQESFQPNKQRQAVDFVRAITRDIWRERMASGGQRGDVGHPATDEECQKSIEHNLMLRLRYADVPVHMTVFAADAERGGRSFGSPEEVRAWNRINKAHGFPDMKGPFRNADKFLQAIIDTPPVRHADGTLHFAAGFNGHGAPGGAGMSLHSNGANSLSSSLMSSISVVKAYEEHMRKHRDVYLEQHNSGKSAYIKLFYFCCYSQDQTRNNRGSTGNDTLSRLENIAAEYRVRPMVFVVGEQGKPGYYQPGTVIPVLGVRAFADVAERNGNKLTWRDLYDSVAYGGEGVLSNPTGFFVDRRRPLMFQVF
jgi:hypothetical protein